jgi:hypothetical protein
MAMVVTVLRVLAGSGRGPARNGGAGVVALAVTGTAKL